MLLNCHTKVVVRQGEMYQKKQQLHTLLAHITECARRIAASDGGGVAAELLVAPFRADASVLPG